MKLLLLSVIVSALFICSSNGLAAPKLENDSSSSSAEPSFPIYWFTQTLNHYDAEDDRTFQQRFWFNDQYYNYKMGGPVILYINGEGPVSGPPSNPNDANVVYAKYLNAMIVTLEHRYYGDSSPFDDLSTENLKFLSSQQALFDLANFVTSFSQNLTNFNGKIVTIGGSYSGALSAWFRLKFPQITVGSLASSGVVNAILDFTAFDEWVAFSAGEECADALRLVTKTAELYVFSGNGEKVKSIFNAEMLTDDGDFFYWLADSMAEGIQYGYHFYLCNPLVEAMNSNGDMLAAYANYTTNVWGKTLGTPAEYATSWQQNTTHDIQKADRQWWYQTCSQLGYFQNAPASGSIRSFYVNMTYHRNHCLQVFGLLSNGEQLWPNTEATNIYYGGNHTAGTNIIFTEGSQDPWSRASVMSQQYPTEPLLVSNCLNCGHCVDLIGSCPGGCSIPNNLDQVRNETLSIIQSWLE